MLNGKSHSSAVHNLPGKDSCIFSAVIEGNFNREMHVFRYERHFDYFHMRQKTLSSISLDESWVSQRRHKNLSKTAFNK